MFGNEEKGLTVEDVNSNEFWVADSGASVHMGNCKKGMFETEEVNEKVRVGSGEELQVELIGKKKVKVIQADGTNIDVLLNPYKYVPDLCANLFSLTKALDNGWELNSKGKMILISKQGVIVKFDQTLKTGAGFITGVRMIP